MLMHKVALIEEAISLTVWGFVRIALGFGFCVVQGSFRTKMGTSPVHGQCRAFQGLHVARAFTT